MELDYEVYVPTYQLYKLLLAAVYFIKREQLG